MKRNPRALGVGGRGGEERRRGKEMGLEAKRAVKAGEAKQLPRQIEVVT